MIANPSRPAQMRKETHWIMKGILKNVCYGKKTLWISNLFLHQETRVFRFHFPWDFEVPSCMNGVQVFPVRSTAWAASFQYLRLSSGCSLAAQVQRGKHFLVSAYVCRPGTVPNLVMFCVKNPRGTRQAPSGCQALYFRILNPAMITKPGKTDLILCHISRVLGCPQLYLRI